MTIGLLPPALTGHEVLRETDKTWTSVQKPNSVLICLTDATPTLLDLLFKHLEVKTRDKTHAKLLSVDFSSFIFSTSLNPTC